MTAARFSNKEAIQMLKKAIKYVAMLFVLALLVPVSVFAENSYSTVQAWVPVVCPDFGGRFIIETESSSPLPNVTVLQVEDGGKKEFELIFDEPGTYTYVIRQEAGARKDMNYDDALYDIVVQVSNSGENELESEVLVAKRGSDLKSGSAEFKNILKETKKDDRKKDETRTGDETNIVKWIIIFVAAVVCLTTIIFIRFKAEHPRL